MLPGLDLPGPPGMNSPDGVYDSMMLDLEEGANWQFFVGERRKKGPKGKVDLTKIPFTKQVVGGKISGDLLER